MKAAAALLLGTVALATQAQGQTPAADAIDSILRSPATPVEGEGPASGPPPQPARLTAPVFVHETGKAPDGPPTAEEAAYDSRLKSSAAAVRGFQGPMEGAWALSGGGRDLYLLQLIDRDGWIEGAWRDPRRTGATSGSGYIDETRRGGDLTLRFNDDTVAVLRPYEGGWRGELNERGRTTPVILGRRTP